MEPMYVESQSLVKTKESVRIHDLDLVTFVNANYLRREHYYSTQLSLVLIVKHQLSVLAQKTLVKTMKNVTWKARICTTQNANAKLEQLVMEKEYSQYPKTAQLIL